MIRDRWADNPSPFNSDTSDAAERALIGACLYLPELLAFAAAVNSMDFRSYDRGVLFSGMRVAAAQGWRGDAISLSRRLEKMGSTPPAGMPGWYTTVAKALEWDNVADEVEVREYSRIVREASVLRRTAGRLGAAV